MIILQWTSAILGWIYVTCWSVSLYPQLYYNWKRKSVRGLSIDYLCYSTVGFICYSIFTVAFYFNQEIQQEYCQRYNSRNLVRFNDIAFALHGLLISLLLIYQTYIFKGNKSHLSSFTATITWLICMSGLLILFSIHYGNTEWIQLIYLLSYVKLGADTFKYLPQIWLNYRRQSTSGWSVYLILLDTLGGICSIAQLVVDAYVEQDWSGISGDAVKLGLGSIAIVYGIIFMFQHYVLYRKKNQDETVLIGGSHRSYGTWSTS